MEARSYEQIVESILTALTTPPSPLTDRSVGSVTRTLAEAMGWEIAYLERQVQTAHLWGFVDTAEGDALDRVVALLGVTRRRQETAAGHVRFYRQAGVTGAVAIAAGTRVSAADPPVAFETIASAQLAEGSNSVMAEVRALTPGAGGLVAPGAITVVNLPLAGISRVENLEGTYLGGTAETDAQLRDRARRALEAAGRATVGAIRSGLLEVPGVRGVSVQENPLKEPGVIRVAVDCPPQVRPLALAALEKLRPAGVRVVHNLESGVQEVPFSVKLALSLREETMRDAACYMVEKSLREKLGRLQVGEALSLQFVTALAMTQYEVTGVQAALLTDSAHGLQADGRLLVAGHERLTLEQILFVDWQATLQADLTVTVADASGSIALPGQQVETDLHNILTNRLQKAVDEARLSPVTLTAEQLAAAVTENSAYKLLKLTVAYELPGVYHGDVAAIPLAVGQRAVLRTLRVVTETAGGIAP